MKARLLGAAALICFVTSASADIITVEIDGLVSQYAFGSGGYVLTPQFDHGGVFGSPSHNLDGDPFTSFFTIDTGNNTGSRTIVSDLLTINGITVNIGGGVSGGSLGPSQNISIPSIPFRFDFFREDMSISLTDYTDFWIYSAANTGPNINIPGPHTIYELPTDLVNDNTHGVGGDFAYGGTFAYLDPSSYTITNQTITAAVPGPIVGSGLPGLLLGLLAWWRSRR